MPLGAIRGRDRRLVRDWLRVSSHWLIGHRLVLAVGLIAALPVVVSTAHALVGGWAPVLDDGLIATNAFDVSTANSRLVGIYSDASVPGEHPVYGLGPMLFWLLTLQTHLLGDWALPVTAGLINTASIVGIVGLAHRRGGPVFMFATAVALGLMCASMPPETLHAILNPWVVLLPLTLLFFLAWSLACGEYRLLPLMTLVFSFVVQTHFSIGLPSAVVLLVGSIGLARVRGRDQTLKPWLVGALAVAVVCWSAPLIDQAVHRPGNFVATVRAATAHEENLPTSSGWHALVKAIGVRPWWLRSPRTSPERVFEIFGAPSTVGVVSCLSMLGGLLIVGLVAVRRRQRDVVSAAALALALSGTIVLVVVAVPARLAFHVEKVARWTSPTGMFVWLVFGWSLAALLLRTDTRAARRLRAAAAGVRPVIVAVVGLAITALVAVLVARKQEPDQFQSTYRPVATIESRLSGKLTHERPVLVTSAGSFDGAFAIHLGLIYRLRQQGYEVVTEAAGELALAPKFGPAYSPESHPPGDAVLIDDRDTPAQLKGSRVVARVRLHGVRDDRTVTASIVPAAELVSPPAPR